MQQTLASYILKRSSTSKNYSASISNHDLKFSKLKLCALASRNNISDNSFTGRNSTYERVLRYPDGHVRRIRYPVPQNDDQPSATLCQEPSTVGYVSQDEDFDAEAWKSLGTWAPETPSHEAIETRKHPTSMPSSPAELLRLLTSDAYRAAEDSRSRQAAESYSILEGCPWPIPRPLFILALAPLKGIKINDATAEASKAYMLRVRLPRTDIEEEITRLLGRRRPDGSNLIDCSELKDGIVAFENEVSAEQFAIMVEETKPGMKLEMVECSSHALFRMVKETSAVVVLIKEGIVLPEPHRLASVLKKQPSLDDKK